MKRDYFKVQQEVETTIQKWSVQVDNSVQGNYADVYFVMSYWTLIRTKLKSLV